MGPGEGSETRTLTGVDRPGVVLLLSLALLWCSMVAWLGAGGARGIKSPTMGSPVLRF